MDKIILEFIQFLKDISKLISDNDNTYKNPFVYSLIGILTFIFILDLDLTIDLIKIILIFVIFCLIFSIVFDFLIPSINKLVKHHRYVKLKQERENKLNQLKQEQENKLTQYL